ncbi:hypothetical protein SDC9_191082 [bioreactor metagenome]|uniref:Uncharacterized protein n=1 Tax=bioreactor metagenome TaxID=1076179 RepID=A0A645HYE9_9ZZZZ
MINTSVYNNALPSVMLRYLFTTLAIISVPPELPLFKKTSPIPPPITKPPSTQAMKLSFSLTKVPFGKTGITLRKKVSIATPIIVRKLNCHPTILNAITKRSMLIDK